MPHLSAFDVSLSDSGMASNPQGSLDTKTQNSSSANSQRRDSQAWWSRLWRSHGENIRIVAIALFLAIIIRVFIAEPRYIPSDSMAPTLQVGDRLVIEKVSYRFRPPAAGEIIVFDPPPQLQAQGYSDEQAFIKRVIGMPGQQIAVHDGAVVLDGQTLQEDYIAESPHYELLPITIPQGSYFVMGDNRNNSNDSHIWGFLPREHIIGRAVFRFWSPQRLGRL